MRVLRNILITVGLVIPAVGIPTLLHQREKARITKAAEVEKESAFFARALRKANSSTLFHNLINLSCRAYGRPYVSVCRAGKYPNMAMITVVWPSVVANQTLINPDENRPDAFPPMAKQVPLDSIPESATNWNCQIDDYANVFLPSREKECIPE